jgi:hypothetical protein
LHAYDGLGVNIKTIYHTVLKKITLKGICGASFVNIIKEKHNICKIVSCLDNFADLWELDIPLNQIFTNDISKIVAALGIEAGRAALLNELRDVLSHYGLYVNVRHLLVLVDWMTRAGIMTPTTRHGMKRVVESPLRRATFEEVVDVFTNAAAFKEKDGVEGIAERIVVGAPPSIGTNANIQTQPDLEIENNPWAAVENEENPWAVPFNNPVPFDNPVPFGTPLPFNNPLPFGTPLSLAYTGQGDAYDPEHLPQELSLAYTGQGDAYDPERPISPAYLPPERPISPAYLPPEHYRPTSPTHAFYCEDIQHDQHDSVKVQHDQHEQNHQDHQDRHDRLDQHDQNQAQSSSILPNQSLFRKKRRTFF